MFALLALARPPRGWALQPRIKLDSYTDVAVMLALQDPSTCSIRPSPTFVVEIR